MQRINYQASRETGDWLEIPKNIIFAYADNLSSSYGTTCWLSVFKIRDIVILYIVPRLTLFDVANLGRAVPELYTDERFLSILQEHRKRLATACQSLKTMPSRVQV